jgi:hypothetical protein
MAWIWTSPHRGDGLYWRRPEQVQTRLQKGAQNPTLLPQRDILVRVDPLRSVLLTLSTCASVWQKIHPSSRVPAKKLAADIGKDWRTQRSWEIERWFERLPMYLMEEPKRQKVVKALSEALFLAESGKLNC